MTTIVYLANARGRQPPLSRAVSTPGCEGVGGSGDSVGHLKRERSTVGVPSSKVKVQEISVTK